MSMLLKKVKVEHFRNIIDSSVVEIEDDITCLVGKNESGKTAFLTALYRLKPVRSNAVFSVVDQYPAWLGKQDLDGGESREKVKPISATFLLESSDLEDIEQKFGKGVIASNQLFLTRNYAGSLLYTFSVDESVAVKHFLRDVQLPHTLLAELRNAKTIENLSALIERYQSNENDPPEVKAALSELADHIKESITARDLKTVLWHILQDRVPQFFYFDKYSTFPYSINIKKLLEADDDQLDDGELTARAILKLASVDGESLVTDEYELRKRELENVANTLTNDVLKYWSQNPSLRVLPDITQKTEDTPEGKTSVIDEIKFRIWDERHSLSLPFNDHSSGFQWFFSFLAAFSEFENLENPVIILLDEPALGLHARAQKDFLQYIEEKLAPKCQVIYTTHSPFMIVPDRLDRIRIVEDGGTGVGAKVRKEIVSTDPDTLFPLQGALGYDLSNHLFTAPHNLVVDGISDFSYITLMSDYFRDVLQLTCLDERWSIIPLGGTGMISSLVALQDNQLDVTVLVDSLSAGNQKLSSLASRGFFREKRLIHLGEIVTKRHASIEDLFEVDDYLKLYNLAYSDSLKARDLPGTGSVLSQIAMKKNIPVLDRSKPAEVLIKNRDKLLPSMSDVTIKNFTTLFIKVTLAQPKAETPVVELPSGNGAAQA
jgi:predicted ATP-dependent endonuclease of OLD family